MSFEVLLFYRYVQITDPAGFVESTRELCHELDLLGRILIASEGVNGTVSGECENTRSFMGRFQSLPDMGGIEFKIEAAAGHAFKRLVVKPRNEIVALGLPGEADIDPNTTTGKRLSPTEFLRSLEEADDDVVLLDARNNYESDLGHFHGAVCPDVENFRDFPAWIRENLADKKDKKILTYCTGGIRCEKLSGFLIEEGFSDVSQLEGGIIKYGQDENSRGKYFDGKCYVFDSRVSTDSNFTETRTVISHCTRCGEKCERYVNCAYPPCNLQFFCCEPCESESGRFCSESCSVTSNNQAARPLSPKESA